MNHSTAASAHASTSAQAETALTNAFEICIEKTRRNIRRLADEPKTCALAPDGDYFSWPEGFFDIGNWTSSFFTGMALISFQITKDTEFLKQVNRLAGAYSDKLYRHGMDTMHDLGFLYSLYSVGLWKVTGSTEQRSLGIKAAEELAKRFIPAGEYIQAWGRMDERGTDFEALAIVDCMMNLPLLFWASEETGNDFFRQLAIKHANTTAKLFVRSDDSVCHAYRFDIETGAPAHEDNYCGAAVGSHWSRGTAWAIYGFALAHRYTGIPGYRGIAQRLAKRFMSLLDEERVPVWDFCLSPQDGSIRDSSAAAIAATAFYELDQIAPGEPLYRRTADELLLKLCERYLDTSAEIPGLLRDAQVGDCVGVAKNAYASWGDFYFVEALARRLHGLPTYW